MINQKKKVSGIILFILVIVIVGVSAYNKFSKPIPPSVVGEGQIEQKHVIDDELVNILITGVDIGNPKSRLENDPKRTDTIMLMNYNPNTENVNVVSIPRDTLVKIGRENYKINSINALIGEKHLVECVEKLLGVNINYYAQVDYRGFREIIDVIGGIDIKIKNRMDYDDFSQNLHIHFKKGELAHLDGEKAEEFFRWRKNNDGTGLALGDLDRIQNQHEFVNKVISKFKSTEIIPKIPYIFDTVHKYTKTNMKLDDIIKYGYKFIKLDRSNINIVTLQGNTDYLNGISYFIYEPRKNRDLLNILDSNITYTQNNEKKIIRQ